MYYTINVYNTTTFPVTVWLGRNYTSSGFPVPTTSIFHTNHNINFSYFRLHLSMHQQQVKKTSPAHNGSCPRKINTGHNKGI